MISKQPIMCIAISAAVALMLFAGTAHAAPNGAETDARKGRELLTVLRDASGRLDGAKFYAGRYIFNQASGPTGRPIFVTDLSNNSIAFASGRRGALFTPWVHNG